MASFEIVVPEPKPAEVIKLNLTAEESNALLWVVYQSRDAARACNLSSVCSSEEKKVLAPLYKVLCDAIELARVGPGHKSP